MSDKFEVRYKCACMADEARFSVRFRQPNEKIEHWMEHILTRALGTDHAKRSPECRSTATEYVMLPYPDGTAFLGGKPE